MLPFVPATKIYQARNHKMARNRFFLIMSTLFLGFVLIGFSRSFYLKSYFDFPALPVHLHFHGIALSSWFLLACLQPWLVNTGKVALHRKLGALGIAIAASVIVTGIWTLVLRDAPDIAEQPGAAAGNIASLLMFLYCVSFGVVFRRDSGTHKRLMLLASVPILAPALDRFARIPFMNDFWGNLLYWFPAPTEVAFAAIGFLLLVATVIANDVVSERRLHKGTLIGLVSIFVLAPATTYLIFASGSWVGLVRWLT
jgi:hypothetical protein